MSYCGGKFYLAALNVVSEIHARRAGVVTTF